MKAKKTFLLFSVFCVAQCGLIYELILGAAASYLIGSAVTQYSIVIGLFLSAMGLGSYLSKYIDHRFSLVDIFIAAQLLIAVIGGLSSSILFVAFASEYSMNHIVYTLTLAIGTLVGLEIPILMHLLKENESFKDVVAHVLAFDYLGALVASLAFPLIILPTLGLTAAAALFGIINVLVAAMSIAVFRHELRRGPVLCSSAVAVLLMLMLVLFKGSSIQSFYENSLYPDEIVHSQTSKYQRIVVTRWRDDVRLFLNGHIQFSSKDEYRYHESLVYPALATRKSATPEKKLQVLILGGGDGLAAKHALDTAWVASVDLVDLDPAVTELFRSHAYLKTLNGDVLRNPIVRIKNMDAFQFVRNSKKQYDVILVDLPDPGSAGINKLYTNTFYRMLKRRLLPGGVTTIQAGSPFFTRKAYWCIHATMQTVFAALDGSTVRPYHNHVPSFGEWGFIMAQKGPASNQQKITQWPQAKYMDQQQFSFAQKFPNDLKPLEVDINTLDKPILMTYNQEGWHQWSE